jgi:hypothetical protein
VFDVIKEKPHGLAFPDEAVDPKRLPPLGVSPLC